MGPPAQDRSRRAPRRALDINGLGYMELSCRGGGFPRARPRHTEHHSGNSFCSSSYSVTGRWPIHHCIARFAAALQRRLFFIEIAARRFADSAVAGDSGDFETRTLSPLVERFIECVREVAKSFAMRPQRNKKS